MKNSDHIEGDDLYIRLLFRLADEKERDITDGCIQKALYETNISVAQYDWSSDGIADYTLQTYQFPVAWLELPKKQLEEQKAGCQLT